MKRIITISREFGSGGRELGKRLGDALSLPVYDHEIIEQLAEAHALTPAYISEISEKPVQLHYTQTIGRRFTVHYPAADRQLKLLADQEKLIRRLAEHECIIVGRAADVLLADMKPFNIFVYADMTARIGRCMERAEDGEELSADQMKKKIRKIDRERASYHGLFADTTWGRKENYTLCVNTTGVSLKALTPAVKGYIDAWYAGREGHDDQ